MATLAAIEILYVTGEELLVLRGDEKRTTMYDRVVACHRNVDRRMKQAVGKMQETSQGGVVGGYEREWRRRMSGRGEEREREESERRKRGKVEEGGFKVSGHIPS